MVELEFRIVHARLDGGDFVLSSKDAVFDAFDFGAFLLGKSAGFCGGFRRALRVFQGFVGFRLVFLGGLAVLAFFQVVGVVAGGDVDTTVLEGDDLVADTV